MGSFISPFDYGPIFYYTTWALCIALSMGYLNSPNNSKLLQQNRSVFTFLLCIVLAVFLGIRPDSSIFGDSYFYIHTFNNFISAHISVNWHEEWAFAGLQTIVQSFGGDHHAFFMVVAIGYIGFIFAACKTLLWENTWMALLFNISSFSFYQYGVNGIRCGMATSMVLFSIALIATNPKRNLLFAIILFALAFGCHRSVILPIGMSFIAMFVLKNPKYAIGIWVVSIFLSLVAGGAFQGLLGAVLGAQDSRAASYTSHSDMSQFSHSGFRWDFILYSSAPVVLTYYVVIKRGIQDNAFNFLSTVYILSNSAWVLINKVAFSNRFAFLSWFMYPMVLAYAFIRLHLWDDQDKRAAYALMGHTGFTIVMYLLGKVW